MRYAFATGALALGLLTTTRSARLDRSYSERDLDGTSDYRIVKIRGDTFPLDRSRRTPDSPFTRAPAFV